MVMELNFVEGSKVYYVMRGLTQTRQRGYAHYLRRIIAETALRNRRPNSADRFLLFNLVVEYTARHLTVAQTLSMSSEAFVIGSVGKIPYATAAAPSQSRSTGL